MQDAGFDRFCWSHVTRSELEGLCSCVMKDPFLFLSLVMFSMFTASFYEEANAAAHLLGFGLDDVRILSLVAFGGQEPKPTILNRASYSAQL